MGYHCYFHTVDFYQNEKFENTSNGTMKEVVSMNDFESQLSTVQMRKEEFLVNVTEWGSRSGGRFILPPSVDEVLGANQSPVMMLLRLSTRP